MNAFQPSIVHHAGLRLLQAAAPPASEPISPATASGFGTAGSATATLALPGWVVSHAHAHVNSAELPAAAAQMCHAHMTDLACVHM